MQTLTGGAIGGCPRVLDRWQRALIILAEGEWTNGLDYEMKGLDSIIGTTGCEDIESEVKLVSRLQSIGWDCRSWGQEVRNGTYLFQCGVISEHSETIPVGDTVVE